METPPYNRSRGRLKQPFSKIMKLLIFAFENIKNSASGRTT